MIRKGDKNFVGFYVPRFQYALLMIAKGADIVWMRVRSCYGSGRWIQEKPWLDNEKWKNDR